MTPRRLYTPESRRPNTTCCQKSSGKSRRNDGRRRNGERANGRTGEVVCNPCRPRSALSTTGGGQTDGTYETYGTDVNASLKCIPIQLSSAGRQDPDAFIRPFPFRPLAGSPVRP